MLVFPNAKINIGLYITARRPDGYHNLESCFYPVPWCDGLEIIEADKLKFTVSGLQVPGNTDDNLCLKAYNLLNKQFSLPPVHIHLHKILPMGAGLGGGSADAAFTLKALDALFKLNLSLEQLVHFASKLGSDCAFFIVNKPAYATQKGEVLEPINLDLKRYYMVIVYPCFGVSTAQAYSVIKPKQPGTQLLEALKAQPENWKQTIGNDFEEALLPFYPDFATIKSALYNAGALYASMSGSGSAFYGLFKEQINAKVLFPGHYLVWEGFL